MADTYVNADCLPGMLDGWCGPIIVKADDHHANALVTMDGATAFSDAALFGEDLPLVPNELPLFLDTRRPEVQDHAKRRLGKLLGTREVAPRFRFEFLTEVGNPVWSLGGIALVIHEASTEYCRLTGLFDSTRVVPALATILLDSPDREALALACILRWASEEVRAGRLGVKHA